MKLNTTYLSHENKQGYFTIMITIASHFTLKKQPTPHVDGAGSHPVS